MKTQTFKQFQLERLVRDGTVIPASKLAEAKDLELKRSRDFEVSIEDEEGIEELLPPHLKKN